MNYANLFYATLPETFLEIAALFVLVFDLALLRKAALKTRLACAALLGIAGCAAALMAVSVAVPFTPAPICCSPRAARPAWRNAPSSFSPRSRFCCSSIPASRAMRANTLPLC